MIGSPVIKHAFFIRLGSRISTFIVVPILLWCVLREVCGFIYVPLNSYYFFIFVWVSLALTRAPTGVWASQSSGGRINHPPLADRVMGKGLAGRGLSFLKNKNKIRLCMQNKDYSNIVYVDIVDILRVCFLAIIVLTFSLPSCLVKGNTSMAKCCLFSFVGNPMW